MNRILTICASLLIAVHCFSQTGEIKPITAKSLQAPNNATWYFNTPDTAVWIAMGVYGQLKLASNQQLVKYYVPYNDALRDVNLGSKNITSTQQNLPINIGVRIMPDHINNGNGTITLGNNGLFCFAKVADGSNGVITLPIAATSTITLTDGVVNFVYADYGSGTPTYQTTLDNGIFKNDFTKVPVIRATREGNTVHFEEYDLYGLLLANKLMAKDIYLHGGERLSGLILSTAPTRISTVSGGNTVFAVQYYDNMAANIAGSAGLLYEYYLVSGVWNKALVTSYDASYYSDGTNRQPLNNNKWVAKYMWRDVGDDNEVYYVHGNQYNSQSEAVNELVPMAPTVMTAHSIYVGKIVIQKDALNGTALPRIWEGAVQTTGVSNHYDLSGSSLVWSASGHTGTANTLAAFDSGGLATNTVVVSDATYSASWDGVSTIAPSKNAVYDKISTLEAVNYCATSMTVTAGTLNQGTVADLCAVGGTDVIVQEQVTSPPFQINLTFTGVQRVSGFKFYGRYAGGATHNVHIEAYNYSTLAWDYVGELSTTAAKQWYAYNFNLPNNYLSANTVQVRFVHQASGINTHQMILDYVNVNYGGGGGSGFITAGAVEFVPSGNISATNVQAAIQELDTEKEPVNANIQQHITNDGDLSATNEIQTIAISSSGTTRTATLSNSNSVAFDVADNDNSSANELQTISTNGNAGNITLSNSGGTLNLNVNDADSSPTNEIQDLSGSGATLSGYQISLSSDATPVTLPNEIDGSTTNEIQAPTLVGDNIGLTQTTTTISISGKEDKSNKVTSISGSSTDTQYPSAKLLYDQLALKLPSTNISGTSGYLSVFTGTNTLGNSPIYTNGNNVGISKTNPIAKFDLGLDANFGGNMAITDYNFIGSEYASGKLVVGNNVKAYEGTINKLVVANTNAVVGYNAISIGFDGVDDGIKFFTYTGSVTAGATISNERLAIKNDGYVKISNLSGTGTRLTTASSDGTLGAITNASGFLKNDGYGGFSYTYPEITSLFSTGSPLGYIATSNGSGGIEMRTPPLNITSFIKSKSATGIFNLAHSTVAYNNMLFVGERAANPKIVKFSNINDLSVYSSITISGVGSAGAGLETGFYVSSIGKVCFIGRNNTAGFDIIEVDPNTMAYTQHNFASITGLSGIGGTDGTYIYYSNYSTMYKIRVSDWAIVASNPLPANLQWPHSISVNPARGEFYMTGSIIDPIYMIKVNTSDLSYTQINLSSYITHATDDMCFYDNGTICKVFVGGEQFYGTEPYCGVVVETTNGNALSPIHIKPSYGLFIDGVKIYSASLDGYIQTFSALDPTNVSTFVLEGYAPNEVLATSTGRTFLTHWDATNSVLAEFYVPVPMPDPTSAVTSVFGRSGAVVAASGDYTAAQVTNAADKSTSNIFADNITISKSISPYFEIANTGASTTGGGFRVSDESGFYRGTWGYNNNTDETYFFNQFDNPYKFILNNVEQFRMNTSGVFETRNLSSAPTAARSGFGGFYTKNNLPYFINSSGTETQLGSASGSMVYPSNSGLAVVSGGVAWGTTIPIPGNTTQFLRADGTFATPTFTSQWTTDTYGVTYANNVGIGVASSQNVKQTVLGNISGYPVFAGQNTNSNGHGAYIYGGSTSSDYTLRLYNYSGGSELFNVRGNGDIYAPNLQSGTTSYAVYYNDVTKRLTWGAAGGGGGGSGTVTSFSAGNFSPLFTTSVSNATTTPALSFSAVAQAANLVYASPNGSTGTPSFRKVVVGDISATGTAGVGTFLQGNGTWETAGWAKDTYGYSSAGSFIGIGTSSTNFIGLSVVSPVAGAYIKSGNSGMYALSIQANANTSGTPLFDMMNGSGSTVGSVDATGDMKLNGSIKIGNETDGASAANVGTIRYRADSNNSYCEMVMQTGASTYAWVIIKQNSW